MCNNHFHLNTYKTCGKYYTNTKFNFILFVSLLIEDDCTNECRKNKGNPTCI